MTDEGVARIIIPRGGSQECARLFARQHTGWVQRQLQLLALRPRPLRKLAAGCEILYRGFKVVLSIHGTHLQFADQKVELAAPLDDLSAPVRERLWDVARREFVPRTFELAARHGLKVRRVLVRNQRARWGACSSRRTISLNWRLIQAPAFVSDYLIIHELMHLREMNHSPDFWRHVAGACARYEEAEQWLDDHDHLLRQG